jgi:HK97 family phage prohead protease
MKTHDQLLKEFGSRVCTLTTGAAGLRGGLTCAVKEVPGDEPMLDFISSDNTLDRYNEVIDQSGWELDNFLSNPVIPDCHDYSSIGKILGKDVLPKNKQIQGGKLCCRVLFAVDNPMGNLAYKMAKGGFIKSQSVGFIPLEWTMGTDSDGPARTYTRCELLEKSLVVVPANPGATIGMALKQGVVERRDLRELSNYLKDFFNKEADPRSKTGSVGQGVNGVRVLRLSRQLRDILKS